MRFALLSALLLLCVTVMAGCSGSTTTSNPSGDQNSAVAIRDFNFNPTTVNIHKGSAVPWTNTGGATHTVTANDGSFDSGNIAAGGSYSHTFDAVGTFAYHCKLHASMTGTITVTA
ncbi:MAG: plastocyanin/azurin family copper-binding protein [bacterium]